MSTYAVAHLRNVRVNADIVRYLERIEDTLQPFEGRFVVHGGEPERVEGDWSGDLVVIEFPDRRRARGWYGSAEYQAILPLRTDNSEATVIFVDTAAADHRAVDVLAG